MADRVVVMGHGRVQQAGTPEEIFEHPANGFVMNFLGQVNVFHGRVQNGKAHVGSLELEYPEYSHDESRPATVYVRPHELDLDRSPASAASLAGRVLHVNPVGPVARVQVAVDDFGLDIHVDLTPDRLAELRLQRGDAVYVSPRRVRVFVPEYSI